MLSKEENLGDLIDRHVNHLEIREFETDDSIRPEEEVQQAAAVLRSSDLNARIDVFDKFYMIYPRYISDDVIASAIEMVELPADPSMRFHLIDSATWLFDKFVKTDAVKENRACLMPMIKCVLGLIPQIEEPEQVATCYSVLARICNTHEDIAITLASLEPFLAVSVGVVDQIIEKLKTGEYEEFADCLWLTSYIFFLFKELLKIPVVQTHIEFVRHFAFLFMGLLNALTASRDFMEQGEYNQMSAVVLEFLRRVVDFFPDSILQELIERDAASVLRPFLMSKKHSVSVLFILARVSVRENPAFASWIVSSGVLDILSRPECLSGEIFSPIVSILHFICQRIDPDHSWVIMNDIQVIAILQTILSGGSATYQLDAMTLILSLVTLEKKDWLGYVCNNYFSYFSLIPSLIANDSDLFCSTAIAAITRILEILERQRNPHLVEFVTSSDLIEALSNLEASESQKLVEAIEAFMDTN